MATFSFKLYAPVEREGDPETWPVDFEVRAEIAWQGDGDSPEVEDIEEVTFLEADGREITLIPSEMRTRFGEDHYADLLSATRHALDYADHQDLSRAWAEAGEPDYD